MATSPGAWAQQSATSRDKIIGTVTDETGVGLPGVSIALKGTQQGTSADAEGNYTLAVSDEALRSGTLVFSFIRYTAQEVPIAGRRTIDLSLKASEQSLDQTRHGRSAKYQLFRRNRYSGFYPAA